MDGQTRELHPLEVKVLLRYGTGEAISHARLAADLAFKEGQANQALSWLAAKGFVAETGRVTRVSCELTDIGRDHLANGTPEERILRLLAERGGRTLPDIAADLGMEAKDVGSAFGALTKDGAVRMDPDKRATVAEHAKGAGPAAARLAATRALLERAAKDGALDAASLAADRPGHRGIAREEARLGRRVPAVRARRRHLRHHAGRHGGAGRSRSPRSDRRGGRSAHPRDAAHRCVEDARLPTVQRRRAADQGAGGTAQPLLPVPRPAEGQALLARLRGVRRPAGRDRVLERRRAVHAPVPLRPRHPRRLLRQGADAREGDRAAVARPGRGHARERMDNRQPGLGVPVRPRLHPTAHPAQPGHRALREAAPDGTGARQVLRRGALLPLRPGRRHAPRGLLPDRGHRAGRGGQPPDPARPPEDVRRGGGRGDRGQVRARLLPLHRAVGRGAHQATPRWGGSSWAGRASSGPR